jgi:hypothetical protein
MCNVPQLLRNSIGNLLFILLKSIFYFMIQVIFVTNLLFILKDTQLFISFKKIMLYRQQVRILSY